MMPRIATMGEQVVEAEQPDLAVPHDPSLVQAIGEPMREGGSLCVAERLTPRVPRGRAHSRHNSHRDRRNR